MATNDRKDALEMDAASTSINMNSMSNTDNYNEGVENIEVANNVHETSSSMSMDENSTSTSMDENSSCQLKPAAKFEDKMSLNSSPEPVKTVSSTACNDKSAEHGPVTSSVRNYDIPPQSKTTIKDVKPQMTSFAVQTDERSILKPPFAESIGEPLTPSRSVFDFPIYLEDNDDNEEVKREQFLYVKQKYEEHLARQEENLTKLSEFLKEVYVIRKQRPMSEADLEEERKIMASMDQIMNRNMSKIETISDITERIQQEQELVNVLITVKDFCCSNFKNYCRN